MEDETVNVKNCGYIQHKGKKRLISMWRRWYCVLNGRLLLFYRSEADYVKLGKFHECVDLSLVYDVLPALGVENGIQITTHTGPHWLRTTDDKSCKRWLESLQGSIVLRRQGSTLKRKQKATSVVITSEDISTPFLNRQQKSKSIAHVLQRPSVMTEDGETTDKQRSKLSRISLNFIPGHGKKYSTYDGSRSYFRVDPVTTEWEDSYQTLQEKTTDEDTTTPSHVRNRIKKESKKPRPASGSVSNFMLMKGPDSSCEPTETKQSSASPLTRKKNHLFPNLPTSFGVGKLLAHIESSTGLAKRTSKSMNSLLEVPNNILKSKNKCNSSAEMKEINSKSEDVLNKRDDYPPIPKIEIIEITPQHPSCVPVEPVREKTPDPLPTPQTQEAQPITPVDAVVEEESGLDKKNKDKNKKVKDPNRRKSGLAMLRNFFYATKIGMRRKGESSSDDSSRSRKSSKESATPTTTPDKISSARTSLTIETPIERKDSVKSEGAVSVVEGNFEAKKTYECEMSCSSARVIEIVEPQPTVKASAVAGELMVENKNSPKRKSVTFADLTPEDAEVAELLQPALPIKTKVKSPSPGYDIPRTTPIPIPGAEFPVCYLTKSNTFVDDADVSIPPTEENTKAVRKLSQQYIQLTFETNKETLLTTDDAIIHDVITRESNGNKSADRFSFARSETELVQEERVQSLQSESLE